MASVGYVEDTIFEIEKFKVILKSADGKNLRSDFALPKNYTAGKMTKNAFSVGQWKNKFYMQFPGFDVDILRGNGKRASGQTLLGTVRDSYIADE